MFKINKKKDGLFEFTLTSASGQTLLKSLPFSTEAELKHTMHELAINKQAMNSMERKTDHLGKFHFSVKNSKGSIIGKSNLYSSEAGMENGIKNFKKRLETISKL
ncbi:YegP family protein [Costertonia aggregata]|uniref:DUF1508 domain-containing protein n=1 Tax=Costertonia aggregata TaxID=343403 RepID=A0A7H9AUG6_9FLAO|nr:YegP family protein [Costertonia aggregata]QLG47133.1 DUF1508 domain-containing protein [Costertonia aggregata]